MSECSLRFFVKIPPPSRLDGEVEKRSFPGVDSRPCSGAEYSQGGEQRKTLQVIFGNGIAEKNGFRTLWNAKHKRFKRFAQHGAVFLSVVAEPSFPKSEGPNAIIWHVGFAVRDDVFDVLSGAQFYAASKELLRGNRGDAGFLIVARLSRDALADDEFPDVHFPICQTVFVVRQTPSRAISSLLKIRFVIVCFREDREHFVLHSFK